MKKQHLLLATISILVFTFSCNTHRKISFINAGANKKKKADNVRSERTKEISEEFIYNSETEVASKAETTNIQTEKVISVESSTSDLKDGKSSSKKNRSHLVKEINKELRSDHSVKEKKKNILKKANPDAAVGASIFLIVLLIVGIIVLILFFILLLVIQSAANSTSNGSGCYIATMAYGNHDAPPVLTLRSFRDKYLQKKAFGRKFIAWYYKKSPGFVAQHQSKTWLHTICRGYLNVLVFFLRIFFKVR